MLAKRLLRRIALPMIAMLLASTGLFAQDRVVTGKVTDSKDGSSVAGASVVAKGSQKELLQILMVNFLFRYLPV